LFTNYINKRCPILSRGIVLIILLIFIGIICEQMSPLFILLLNGFYCIFWICLKSKLSCIKTKYHFGCMIKSNWLILYNLIEAVHDKEVHFNGFPVGKFLNPTVKNVLKKLWVWFINSKKIIYLNFQGSNLYIDPEFMNFN
jgi:hypothetical protein